MFRSLFGRKKTSQLRQLESAHDLMAGDIIRFKPRSILPPVLQGQQFEINAVGTYQYDGAQSKELQLRSENDEVVHMAVEDEDGEHQLALSLKLSRTMVISLFGEGEFAALWDESFPVLQVKTRPEALNGWLAQSYTQEIKEAEAYYYDHDRSKASVSTYQDDSEELRYHECSGDDDRFGLSVEIWADGSTDVYLVVYTPLEVIADFWPGSGSL